MKKIFTLSALFMVAAIFLAGCVKRDYGYNDDDYWLRKESGVVVYADGFCPYYVVETNNGYTIIRSVGGYLPYEGDIIYGDLSRRGVMNLYNYSDDIVISGEVTDYWLSYGDAQYYIDNLCYSYNRSGNSTGTKKAIVQKATTPKTGL